jgi:AcrR family transcriptional regulator
MAEEIAGRGDPLKTLQLMWNEAAGPRRGPRSRTSVNEIVLAAVRIADADGLEAVSTRRVAEAVGISAMSFYTHIPGKAELLDLMLDAVVGLRAEEQVPRFRPRDWRKNLRMIAASLWDFYMDHPWVLQVATHRPVIGPHTLHVSEIAFSAVDGLGLDELEMDKVITLIANYVAGAVRDAAREKRVKELTGMSDTEWWYTVLPYVETIDFSPYPVLSRIGPKTGEAYGAHDPLNAFNFGLERILDGLALFIEPRFGKLRARLTKARRKPNSGR